MSPIMSNVSNPRSFRPNPNIKGGSKKGKPQLEWPLVYVIVADALVMASKGTTDAWFIDRKCPWGKYGTQELTRRMEDRMPGCVTERIKQCRGYGERTGNHYKEPINFGGLLYNRVYKEYYHGRSARGPNHDPNTRAAVSPEHWRSKLGPNHPLVEVHEHVRKGGKLPNWQEYL